MSSPSAEFEAQLELFRTEAQSAIQFFYAWDATHAVAAKDKAVVRLLNQAPLFWNTALGALQSSSLVALGRIFDPDQNNHSVTRLLALAHKNLDIFSKGSLADRKRKLSENADEWLDEYLKHVYEPTGDDFRRLKRHVAKRRKLYEEIYRPLRHKVLAHRGVATKAEVSALFAKTNLQELRQLLIFLESSMKRFGSSISTGTSQCLDQQGIRLIGCLARPHRTRGIAICKKGSLMKRSSFSSATAQTPNPSIERTRPGKPGRASHVKR
ncbi:MAG: hypothetical protein KF892_24175 [Rhizobacter sp.]|nr:hypothetical protein [Rhizobacter sp.]